MSGMLLRDNHLYARFGREVFEVKSDRIDGWLDGSLSYLHPLQAVLRPPANGVLSGQLNGQRREVTLPALPALSDVPLKHLLPYQNRGGGGVPVVNAWRRYLSSPEVFAEDGVRSGLPIVWGVLRGSGEIIRHAQRHAWRFFHIDHAYFRRGHDLGNYRVSYCAFENNKILKRPPDRMRKLGVALQPWKPAGRYVLICPPTDYFAEFHGCRGWLQDTVRKVRRYTDRPIVIRAKPRDADSAPPLSADIDQAWIIVTHSSNVAIEAVLQGVPVAVADVSAAAPVGLTDFSAIEEPVRGDREPWAAGLAYCQNSLAEIASGEAWAMICANERDSGTPPEAGAQLRGAAGQPHFLPQALAPPRCCMRSDDDADTLTPVRAPPHCWQMEN